MKIIIPIFILSLIGFTGCHSNSSIADIAEFYNYSTVNWVRIDTMYYRPYAADWSEDIGKQIRPDFPDEIAAKYWHRLQNAKTDFHQQTMPLRAASSAEVCEALDRTESMFDTVFVRCIEQEYYMRLLVDTYNETMPPALDSLCRTFASQNKK